MKKIMEEQSETRIKRFVEKGYKKERTRDPEGKSQIHGHRHSLKIRKIKLQTWNGPGFNRQYKQVENIVKKYWPILKSDKTLKKILPQYPRCAGPPQNLSASNNN